MISSETKPHIKVVDIVPTEYNDFLTYCNIIGKIFSDEITPVDYIAYRSQFGRDKSEVKKLRAIIEAGILLEKHGVQNETVGTPDEEIEAPDIGANGEAIITLELEIAGGKPESDESTEGNNSQPEIFCRTDDFKRTYADILGLNANDYAKILIERFLFFVCSFFECT